MNKRWKALAAVTVAAALVFAPLGVAGAVADEVVPPDETTEVVAPVEEVTPPAAEEAVVEEAPAVVEEVAPVVTEETKVEEPAPVVAEEAVAPATEAAKSEVAPAAVQDEPVFVGTLGELLPWSSPTNQESYWEDFFSDHQASCYKHDGNSDHGSITNGGKTVTLNTFNQSWPGDHWEALIIKGGSLWNNVIVHPSAGVAYASPVNSGGEQSSVSHWIVCKGTTPPPEDIEVTPPTPTFSDPCGPDNASWSGPAFEGGTWGYGSDDEGNLYIEAIPADGYTFGDAQTEWVDKDSGELCEVIIIPPTVDISVDCTLDKKVTVVATNPNEEDVEVELYLDFNGDMIPDANETLVVVPGTTTLHYAFAEDVSVGIGVVFDEEFIYQDVVTVDCEDETYPVPAAFNAAPTGPTCATAGSFSTGFLGEPFIDEGDYKVYDFENVYVEVYTDVPGEVYIIVYAKEGFTLSGLSDAWIVSEDNLIATRLIELPAAIGYQNEDPEAPCFFSIVPQPAAPTFNDVCGTAGDGWTVPNGTDQFEYVVVEDGDTVTITAVLFNENDSWAEGTVTEWSHTFTNEACPTTPPTTPNTPAALASTGGGDVAPIMPIAAAMAVAMGIALAGFSAIRRRVRG